MFHSFSAPLCGFRVVACSTLGGLLATSALVDTADAGAFAIREQSVPGQATSFAGAAARTDDASFIFFNPAVAAHFDAITAAGGVSLIVPTSEFQGGATTVVGSPIAGQGGAGSQGDPAPVPYFTAVIPVTGQINFALAVNAPFGLALEYGSEWQGRYHADESSLTTFNFQPVLAWKPNERFSLAIGGQIMYADATLSNAVDFGLIGAQNGLPTTPGQFATDGFAEVSGDDWGVGFSAGVLFEPTDSTRLGLSFRSEVDVTLEGEGDFVDDPSGVAAGIRASLAAGGAPAVPFVDTGATAEATLPATITASIAQDVHEDVTLYGTIEWAGWDTFNELRIVFDNPAQPDSVSTLNYEDGWFFSVGGDYRLSDALTLSGGVGYEISPVTDADRTPRIPDADRLWLSLGGAYNISDHISVTAAFTHIFVDDAPVNLTATPTNENASRGNLNGQFESTVDIFSIGGSIKF